MEFIFIEVDRNWSFKIELPQVWSCCGELWSRIEAGLCWNRSTDSRIWSGYARSVHWTSGRWCWMCGECIYWLWCCTDAAAVTMQILCHFSFRWETTVPFNCWWSSGRTLIPYVYVSVWNDIISCITYYRSWSAWGMLEAHGMYHEIIHYWVTMEALRLLGWIHVIIINQKVSTHFVRERVSVVPSYSSPYSPLSVPL